MGPDCFRIDAKGHGKPAAPCVLGGNRLKGAFETGIAEDRRVKLADGPAQMLQGLIDGRNRFRKFARASAVNVGEVLPRRQKCLDRTVME